MNAVKDAAGRAEAWLTRTALPLWGGAGVDADGSFHERLHFDGAPDLDCPRRMRVQARQVYVFSEAAVRGWWGPAQGVAEAGLKAMLKNCWAVDGQPGFLHTYTPDKRPLDLRRDTYDHAFGLFALAWCYKASPQPAVLGLAQEALDFVQAKLADPGGVGFVEAIPEALPRRSDPHMHMLEAMLEWTDAAGDERFLRVARQMVDLFRSRFFDPASGTLGEYFDRDLRPAGGPPGQVTAPGHHFEWCWLLAWAKAMGAGAADAEAGQLYDYAVRYGLDAQGLAVDECDRRGLQVRRSRRAWPQTELIKGHIARARQGMPGAANAAAQAAHAFMDSYLATGLPGLWMDQFDSEGRGMTDAAPASTLYHIVVAFRELIIFAQQQG